MRTALEIFAGGGGLAVGLKRAGVQPTVAIEMDPHAASTFRANHPEVALIQDDVRAVSVEQVRQLSGANSIDILAACPPCQGFSSLTSKYRRDDARNVLVFEVSRLVRELLPKAVMFENVPGLAGRGKPLFDQFVGDLEEAGYEVNWGILEVADYGVPQRRKRLVLLAGLGFRIELPAPTHAAGGTHGLPPWRTVKDAISSMRPAAVLAPARMRQSLDRRDWHVIRAISEPNIERLRHSKPGGTWRDLPEHVRPPCHRGGYKGFMNAYGRLDWNKPSATITSGCTSLSKGRFGHPEELRTISVREAALLQTFPRNYMFDTDSLDRACEIIGNALPCHFAEAIALQVTRTLRRVEPWL